MKLVFATVSNSDTDNVVDAISTNGFYGTKISTRGQFLADGHTTIAIGAEENQIDTIKEIISENVTKRTVESNGVKSTLDGTLLKAPVKVEKGGAVIFVIDVDQFEKI